MRHALLTLLLLAAPAGAQSVKLPAEVKGLPGAWLIVPAVVDGGPAKWRCPDPGLEFVGLDQLFPPMVLDMMRGQVVKSDRAGRYRLEAWTAKGDHASDIATCWVVVGEPGPPPPPPAPSDPLWPSMKAAYVADTTTANKTACALQLASVFKVAGTTTAYDPAIPSMGDLFTTISKASQALVPLPALQTTREVVGKELVAKLGSDATAALTPATRKAASEQFTRMAGLYTALAEGK